MSLRSDIQSIIEGLNPTATYMLASKFKANYESIKIESSALPLIVLDNELPRDSEIKQSNNVQKNTKVLISFLNKDDIKNTDLESIAIVEAMEALADKVAVNIYQLSQVIPLSNQKYKLTPLYHVYGTDLSGVALEMNVNYQVIINFTQP